MGSCVVAIGIVLYTASSALPVTLVGTLVAGAGGTWALVGVNAFISDHQGPAAPRSMSESNGLGALAGLLGPIAVGLGVALGRGWRPALLVAAVGFLVVEVVRGRDLNVYDGTHGQREPEVRGAPSGPMPRRYWFAWGVILAVVGTEFCMTLWGSELLRDQAGMGDAAAAASLVTVVGGMALGRLGGAPIVTRVDPERLLVGAFALTGVGFLLAWVSTSPLPMLVGFFVAGTGMGLHWPLGVSRSLRAAEGRSDRGSALASVAAGMASGIAPFVLGALADAVGVHLAFLVVPAMLLGGIALVRLVPVPFTLDSASEPG
jgi:fucose permease